MLILVLAPGSALAAQRTYLLDGEIDLEFTLSGETQRIELDFGQCPWTTGSVATIEDDDGGPAPTLIQMAVYIQCTFTFGAGVVTGVLGSTVQLEFDIRVSNSLGTVGTRTGNEVVFGTISGWFYGGQGVRCTETASGACAAFGMPVGVWGQWAPTVISVDFGVITVTPDFSSFTLTSCPSVSFPFAISYLDSCMDVVGTAL